MTKGEYPTSDEYGRTWSRLANAVRERFGDLKTAKANFMDLITVDAAYRASVMPMFCLMEGQCQKLMSELRANTDVEGAIWLLEFMTVNAADGDMDAVTEAAWATDTGRDLLQAVGDHMLEIVFKRGTH
jgi:hypothetical protein